MLSETENSAEKLLGKGRSATVYAGIDAEGRLVARKVFVGSTLAGLVHYLFFGADNPYIWSPSAIQEAASRRRILTLLVHWWFGSKLRVAEASAITWNQKFRANEMKTELVVGRGASLHHPFSELREAELRDLVHLGSVAAERPDEAHRYSGGISKYRHVRALPLHREVCGPQYR